MVDVDVVAAKLAELADRIARVRARVPATANGLARDRDALDLVAFNLMLAVQSCADIASHIIADEALPPAATIANAFQRLATHGVLSARTAEALGRAVGLRNTVAHGYSGINPAMVHSAAQTGVADLERFGAEVSAWLRKQSGAAP